MNRLKVFNFIAFQAVWMAAVVGAANGIGWIGPACLLAWLPIHFHLSDCRYQDFMLAAVAVAFGTLIDTMYQYWGLLRYESASLMQPMAPLWISTLWVAYVLTLNHSLNWLRGRAALAFAFGAFGGPMAYWAGLRIGALEFVASPALALLVIGCVWALTTPLLVSSPWALERVPSK